MSNKNPYRAAGTFNGISYISRGADDILLSEILENQRYPYCLAPRQSGKSSLLANVINTLDEVTYHAVLIDLSTFTPESLSNYSGFLRTFSRKTLATLDPPPTIIEPEDLEALIVSLISFTNKRIIFFIDEVDSLLPVNFKEVFFAQVRAIYNARSRDSKFERVQFVLTGVAQPSQLIASKYMSPFNIGISIKLEPITEQQTYSLSRFLTYSSDRDRREVCRQINQYTNGSVYLTQLVFESLWKSSNKSGFKVTKEHVEAAISQIILDAKRNIHFTNIYEMLVNNSQLLREFRSFRGGKSIDNYSLSLLEMVGITDGMGPYHNRIYEAVFDGDGPLSLFSSYQRLWQERSPYYYAKISKLYGASQIFGMASPVPLDEIFTDVYMLDKPTAFSRFDIERLKQMSAVDLDTPPVQVKRINGLKLVREKGNYFILGKPGSGKTTFLKYVALEAAKRNINKVPIFVSVKEWADSGRELIQFIIDRFDICDFANPNAVVDYLLTEERTIILFDGLDEVTQESGHRNRQTQEINNFIEKYDRAQCLITCRIAAGDYSFEPFTYVEIADFTEKQIQTFVRNWFRTSEGEKDEATSKKFLAEFVREENKSLRDLARTPLLLALLCMVFDETLTFPQRQVEIFEEALNAMLKKWDSSRRIMRDEIYRSLSLGHKRNMLARIAAETFEGNEYFIPQRRLENLIADYVERVPPHNTEEAVDGETILKAMEAQHGIFSERAREIYSFSHISFQEYLTARYIFDNSSRGTLRALLQPDKVTDPRWRNVILYTSSLLPDADPFFSELQRTINQFIQSDKKLNRFLEWAKEKAYGVGPEKDDTYLRASYLDYAIHLDSVEHSELTSLQHKTYDLAKRLCPEHRMLSSINPEELRNRISSYSNQGMLDYYLYAVFYRLMESSIRNSASLLQDKRTNLTTYIKMTKDLLDKVGLRTISLDIDDAAVAESDNELSNKLPSRLRSLLMTERNIGHIWNFSEKEREDLSRYIESSLLLLDCLRISFVPDRHQIRAQLLNPVQLSTG